MTSQESPSAVIDDLRDFMNDALATSSYARMGLIHEREFLSRPLATAENPDPMIHLGVGDPNEDFAPYSKWTLSVARRQLAADGPVEQRLGQQWIVYTFTAWEHEYRPRLAQAHGIDRDALTIPLFGDLRLLRNDVVHHHGIATDRNSGKCEVLGHWVTLGAANNVTPQRFA